MHFSCSVNLSAQCAFPSVPWLAVLVELSSLVIILSAVVPSVRDLESIESFAKFLQYSSPSRITVPALPCWCRSFIAPSVGEWRRTHIFSLWSVGSAF